MQLLKHPNRSLLLHPTILPKSNVSASMPANVRHSCTGRVFQCSVPFSINVSRFEMLLRWYDGVDGADAAGRSAGA
jgi:hypothetical protein